MGSKSPVVHSEPEILGGTPVFVGTRVPLRNLFDYLERGHSTDEFLDEFPSVSREQAIAALEAAHSRGPNVRCASCSMSNSRDILLANYTAMMSAPFSSRGGRV